VRVNLKFSSAVVLEERRVESMFEFGDIRFRPWEKEDLKQLHQWENDWEVIMYSRALPMNFLSMAQIEKMFEERMKEEKNLYFIMESPLYGEANGRT
jgi:RimJ/RimL family protein N-acetyltransferase